MKYLLLFVLFFPTLVSANPEEGCMDANFSRIYSVDYRANKGSLTIYIQVARPKEVSIHTSLNANSLDLTLHNSFIIRESLNVGCHLQLRDMGGSTLLIVKGGKRLISSRSNDSYLILTVSI